MGKDVNSLGKDFLFMTLFFFIHDRGFVFPERLKTLDRRPNHRGRNSSAAQAAIQIFEFLAILIGHCTQNVTSIVCKYSGSGFVTFKRALEQRGRSIERNSIIREEIEFGLQHLGHSMSSGQQGQKRPTVEDWMVKSTFVDTRGRGCGQISIWDGLLLGNHVGTGT